MFYFQPSYWCQCKSKVKFEDDEGLVDSEPPNQYIERCDVTDMKSGIKIKGLRKVRKRHQCFVGWGPVIHYVWVWVRG